MGWNLFLIKFQARNFPANIAKILRNAFFNKTTPVAASDNLLLLIGFPGKHQWRWGNRFIFLINTTE